MPAEVASMELYSRELYSIMRRAYDELLALVETAGFQRVLGELYELPEQQRPDYVENVILVPEKLREKGVHISGEILVQRSSFGDRRPTLFCIKKYLPKEYQIYWENVNITFDNDFFDNPDIPNDERAWAKPLPIEVQSLLIKAGITEKDLSVGG